MLLDGGLRHAPGRQLLDIPGDYNGVQPQEFESALVAPGAEGADRPGVGGAGVPVADVRREELGEAPGRLLAGAGDRRRYQEAGSGLDGHESLGHLGSPLRLTTREAAATVKDRTAIKMANSIQVWLRLITAQPASVSRHSAPTR